MLLLQLAAHCHFLVQIPLEQTKYVVSHSLLGALVDEIKSFAVDRQHPNDPPLDHPVEIASPGLNLGRESELLTLRRLGGRLCCGCAIDRDGERGEGQSRGGEDGLPRAGWRMSGAECP